MSMVQALSPMGGGYSRFGQHAASTGSHSRFLRPGETGMMTVEPRPRPISSTNRIRARYGSAVAATASASRVRPRTRSSAPRTTLFPLDTHRGTGTASPILSAISARYSSVRPRPAERIGVDPDEQRMKSPGQSRPFGQGDALPRRRMQLI